MARETKFRAWDGNKMIYNGDKVFPQHFSHALKNVTEPCMVFHNQIQILVCETQLPDATDKHFDHISYVPAKEFMQFIGELDKNGREIYSGDVLGPMDNDFRPEYKGNWVVVYDGGTFAAEGNSERISTWIPYWVPDKQIEIIGNKYENPDLLK